MKLINFFSTNKVYTFETFLNLDGRSTAQPMCLNELLWSQKRVEAQKAVSAIKCTNSVHGCTNSSELFHSVCWMLTNCAALSTTDSSASRQGNTLRIPAKKCTVKTGFTCTPANALCHGHPTTKKNVSAWNMASCHAAIKKHALSDAVGRPAWKKHVSAWTWKNHRCYRIRN